MITLRVPGTLRYRDLSVRVVAAACKLVGVAPGQARGAPARSRDFDDQVISAFGEVFNNIAIHGYRNRPGSGEIDIEIEPQVDRMTIRVLDRGSSFDLTGAEPPDLDTLPESGLGIYIVRSFMDEVMYQPGSPNVTVLTKYLNGTGRPATALKEKTRG